MRWAWTVLALCACDRVFGLASTYPSDGRQFDGLPDAPYACPAIGTPLAFSRALHQIQQYCTDYTESAVTGRAVANCIAGSPQIATISEGPIDGTLTTLAGMPVSTDSLFVGNPRLAVDGDQIFVPTFDLSSLVATVQIYVRGSGGTWTRTSDFPVAGVAYISQATPGPEHHAVYTLGDTTPIYEASDAGGTWNTIATFSLSSLQVPSVGAVWLSPDGLRMVFRADVIDQNSYLAYTDRDMLGQPFRPAVRLDAPAAVDPFITFDCSRLYFSALHSIFYENQR